MKTHKDRTIDTHYPGALVISLDLELHWGFFDRSPLDEPTRQYLLGAREAAEDMLQLFRENHIHATWAAVGMLLAGNRKAREELIPGKLPRYTDPRIDPYRVDTGEDEEDDPFHYAPGLAERIIRTPGQELATHTFGHYYCLEDGQDAATFEADLDAAVKAAEGVGYRPRSIIFPRNQHNPEYSPILQRKGIQCYRGNPRHCWYAAHDDKNGRSLVLRAGRLADSYLNLSGRQTIGWSELKDCHGLINLRASRFLRPWSKRFRVFELLKERRILSGLEEAAVQRRIYHIWWHPHNFSTHREEKLEQLRRIISRFEILKTRYGMISLNMGEIVDMVESASLSDDT